MKVIKTYWKSCLCFLLAFLCILGCFNFTNLVYGWQGGGQAESSPYPAASGPAGIGKHAEATGFRVGIFNVDSGDNGYVDISGSNLVIKTNPSAMDNYYDGSKWVYFTPFNKNRLWSDGIENQAGSFAHCNGILDEQGRVAYYPTTVRDTDSDNSAGVAFLQTVGLSSVSCSTTAEFERVLQTIDTALRHIDFQSSQADSLVRAFDADPSKDYIVVLEIADCFDLDRSCYNGYLGRISTSANFSDKVNEYIHIHQDQGVFGVGAPTSAPDGIWFYGNLAGGKKSTTNVSVTYTGDPNTSDGAFDSAMTIGVLDDTTLKSWNGSGWDDNFTLKLSTTGSEYSLMMAGTAKLNAGSANVSANTIQSLGDSIGSFSLHWANKPVSSLVGSIGVRGFGYVTHVDKLNGVPNVSPISQKFNSIANLSSNSFEVNNQGVGLTGDDIKNAASSIMGSAGSKNTDDKCFTSSGQLRAGKGVGLGIEFIARGKPITSYHYRITVRADGSSSVSTVKTMNYNTGGYESTIISDDAACWAEAVISDNNNNPQAIKDGFNQSMTPQQAKSTLLGKLTGTKSGDIITGETVAVGSTTSNEGYVIYEVVFEKPDESGIVSLEDWFLNKYIDNVITTSYSNAHQGMSIKYQLRQSYTVSSDITETAMCGASLRVGTNKDYNITYTETSTGKEVDWDTGNLSKRYYPAASSSTFPGADSRYKFLPSGLTVNTASLSNPRNIEYAFNFVRASVGDVRSFSGISYATKSELDSEDLLKMQSQFGVVPTGGVTTSVGKNQLSGSIEEHLKLNTVYKFTGNTNGKHDGVFEQHHHIDHYDTYTTEYGSYSVPVYCTKTYMPNLTDAVCKGLFVNATPITNMDYKFIGNAYKYQTAELAEGKNSFLEGVDMHALGVNANKPAGATKKNTNEYRYATVHRNTGVDLKFYPENYMVYKIGGTVFDSAPYKYAAVMSEVKRTSESSSLYLFKINTDVEDENSVVTGSTYSDTMQGGTSSFGKSQVSIPAGSDVTILADATNIKLDLYGYALDLIDGSKDTTMSIGAGSNKTYNSVVKSGLDVSSAWGNASDHSEKLKSNFITWADNILQVENFGADFVLKVNNQVKGANFSATVGKVNHTSGAVEDGVYNIVVENGEIVKSAGAYNNMIQQIAADYDCSTAEAETIFTDSQIYTAIMNAIESSTSNFNTSGQATGVAESWTSTLGNANNWYDEKVRTFVVRRYTNLGNTLSDITATDKLDYSLAPNGDDSGKENAGAGTTFNANWYLNIFFNSARKDTVGSLLLENSTYYNPSVSTDISGANNAYSVLIKENHVKDADFLIPASSTSSFGF